MSSRTTGAAFDPNEWSKKEFTERVRPGTNAYVRRASDFRPPCICSTREDRSDEGVFALGAYQAIRLSRLPPAPFRNGAIGRRRATICSHATPPAPARRQDPPPACAADGQDDRALSCQGGSGARPRLPAALVRSGALTEHGVVAGCRNTLAEKLSEALRAI